MTQTSTRILATCAFAVAAFSAWEMASSQTSNSSSEVQADGNTRAEALREDRENQTTKNHVNARAKEITRRIGVSTAFSSGENSDSSTDAASLRELEESGFIIPATLEEVEAALKAAALTPETEDDKAALILKHRGSYRFSSSN
ncbi:MAG: hypothetical protein AB8D78_01710 [Akkermansiaceae bacterium]